MIEETDWMECRELEGHHSSNGRSFHLLPNNALGNRLPTNSSLAPCLPFPFSKFREGNEHEPAPPRPADALTVLRMAFGPRASVVLEIKWHPLTGGRGALDPWAATGSGGHWGLPLLGLLKKGRGSPPTQTCSLQAPRACPPCSPPLFGTALPVSLLHSHLDGPHTDEKNQKCARR